LEYPLVTPTTKEIVHDHLISPKEIIDQGLMTEYEWYYCSTHALQLFHFGQKIAAENGLILVDTKYEFGKNHCGEILLVDEMHTPDSSRYWISDSYQQRFDNGEEPERIDKDIWRHWFSSNCDPYHDEHLPTPPLELAVLVGQRYIELYEKITGQRFDLPDPNVNIQDRIQSNIKRYFEK